MFGRENGNIKPWCQGSFVDVLQAVRPVSWRVRLVLLVYLEITPYSACMLCMAKGLGGFNHVTKLGESLFLKSKVNRGIVYLGRKADPLRMRRNLPGLMLILAWVSLSRLQRSPACRASATLNIGKGVKKKKG